MTARGLLMIEHRLIEKMLKVIKVKMEAYKNGNYDPVVVDKVVDFIKVYADRTHHGKEEDILFKKLESKNLNPKDKVIMQDLINEHVMARKKVGELVSLNSKIKNGEKSHVNEVAEIINWLGDFYPLHIAKEDKVFFPDADKYFDEAELKQMLDDYYAFDARMIHEKYQGLYDSLK